MVLDAAVIMGACSRSRADRIAFLGMRMAEVVQSSARGLFFHHGMPKTRQGMLRHLRNRCWGRVGRR